MDEQRERVAETLDEGAGFFARHAGFSYNPATETAEDGLRRCAVDLATAEQWAEDRGYEVRWADDWDVGSHVDYFGAPPDGAYDREPETCEMAALVNPETGEVLASLGCVDDADDDYRRVIAAELADEARAPFVRSLTN